MPRRATPTIPSAAPLAVKHDATTAPTGVVLAAGTVGVSVRCTRLYVLSVAKIPWSHSGPVETVRFTVEIATADRAEELRQAGTRLVIRGAISAPLINSMEKCFSPSTSPILRATHSFQCAAT